MEPKQEIDSLEVVDGFLGFRRAKLQAPRRLSTSMDLLGAISLSLSPLLGGEPWTPELDFAAEKPNPQKAGGCNHTATFSPTPTPTPQPQPQCPHAHTHTHT